MLCNSKHHSVEEALLSSGELVMFKKYTRVLPCINFWFECYIVSRVGWKSAFTLLENKMYKTIVSEYAIFKHWSEKVKEGENWKGGSPVVTVLRLLIHLDRGPCCETTDDLHMRQRYSGHYIRTSQIIVAVAALKCEVASLPQLPIAFDRIT